MKKNYLIIFTVLFTANIYAREIWVATNGLATNPGTEAAPINDIQSAVDLAQPGDIIWIKGGIYKPKKRIKVEKAGTAEARISMFGVAGERVIIDGSSMTPTNVNEFKQSRCIYVNHFGDYWHFRNLEMCNAKDNGMKLEGSFCIVENCKFYDNNDTGLQLGMYKDFSIEETQSFPISGTPQYNPNYTYCRNNIIINCDSYYNYDSITFSGSDDGGDADGFAAKLFPGPGTEFHGCRAWNNSDDNWDLYMVYHPIIIKECISYKGGYDKNNIARGNGNGFKLGGGGTAGGAAFSQSVGAHVVMNSVAFGSSSKGFDQNNAYEAMYILNNISFDNAYNYRFPTVFNYGTMFMRNNIGFKALVLNHEFLSENKVGSQVPNTDFNSWTTFDGCDPYKDGNKINGTAVKANDHSAEFKSLDPALALADRQIDGSLPDNDFCRLKNGSKFINAGENIENFTPTAHSPGGVTLPSISILYNDGKADMGAHETGDPTIAILTLTSGKADQFVYLGTAIQETVYRWSGAATDVTVSNLPNGLEAIKDGKSITIKGIPTVEGVYTIASVGGTNDIILTGEIKISTVAPASLTYSGQTSQEVNMGSEITEIVFTWGGGATDIDYTTLPTGLLANKDMENKTLIISGVPTIDGTFIVSTIGGMSGSEISYNCGITRVIPQKILTGDWYNFQDEYSNIPSDLHGVVTWGSGTNSSYTSDWLPAYTESNGAAPSGCTVGAMNLERSGGWIQWYFPNGLVELKANIHTTGDRTFKVDYTIGQTEKSWTSATLKKDTRLAWDFMNEIGIEATTKPVTIKFINNATGGGVRMYDFFAKVYIEQPSEIKTAINKPQFDFYTTETKLIVYGDIKTLQIVDTNGRIVAQSALSQVVNISTLNKGVYIVRIEDKNGVRAAQKFMK